MVATTGFAAATRLNVRLQNFDISPTISHFCKYHLTADILSFSDYLVPTFLVEMTSMCIFFQYPECDAAKSTADKIARKCFHESPPNALLLKTL